MKAVQLLVNSSLPPGIRDYGMKMDAGGLEKALASVAREHPDQFADVTQQLANVGRLSSWTRGTSISLNDLKPVIDMPAYYKAMDKELQQARFAADNDDDFQDERNKIWLKWQKKIEQDTMAAGTKQRNSLVTSVASGARGKPAQIAAMIGSPGIYQDSQGNIVPLFVRNSFAQGLRPGELLATTFGARSSVIGGKKATARGGDLSKQAQSTVSDLGVTMKDCGTRNGIDLDIDDDSLRGRVTADGKVLDKRQLADMRNSGLKKVVVRSAMTCEAPEGLCAKCLGIQGDGKFLPIGNQAGITGSHALFEPVIQQLGLNQKHCLAEGTLVRMADFSLRRIEKVKVGEWVLGSDIDGNTVPVEVLAVHDQGMQDVQRYDFVHKFAPLEVMTVNATAEHPILTLDLKLDRIGVGVFQPAKRQLQEFSVGASSLCAVCSNANLCQLTSVSSIGRLHCWDLTVNHPDELFVLENGLIVKNTSGMASAKKEFSGLDSVIQFVQAPEEFPDAAAVSKESGMVESVKPAPQGGNIITVDGQDHYALPGMDILVKPGDQVERGDQLSDGLMNPSDVVDTRGLGEGRRYYADRLKKILDDSGVRADRRNTEILARGALRHVRIDDADEDESWLPDDLVDYNKVRANWKVPEDAREMNVEDTAGKWLVTPALHFTIGTQLTPRMGRQLKDMGMNKVTVTSTQPKFHAEMPRLRTASHVQDDWLASQSTSYLKGQLLSGAERGADTNVQSNLHWAPRLAIGEGFGQNIAETGKF